MANPLFQDHTYSIAMPSPFDEAEIEKTRTDVKSMYRPSMTRVALHAPTLEAAMAIITGDKGGDNDIAVGKQGDYYLVERTLSSGQTVVVSFNPKKGAVKAGVFSGNDNTPAQYKIGKNSPYNGMEILIAAISAYPNETEASQMLEEISSSLNSVDSEWGEKMSKAAAILCDNISSRIESADTLGDNGIKINIPKGGNIQPFSPLSIKEGTYAPSEVMLGEFRVLKSTGAKKTTFKKVAIGELPGKFAFSARKFSQDEQMLIPSISDWYIVPKEVVRIAQHAQATTSSSQPMRNFMMRGPAGVGKTEGARAIASALNLPYLSLTCSANTEIFDLLGQILPDVEGIDGTIKPSVPTVDNPEIPTFEDIQMDAATAYEKMTGIYDEDISHEAVYQKLLEVIRETTAKELQASNEIDTETETSSSQKFRYVETTLVRAMKYGYVIEIQEPSVIANPGVLVGLNSLLDNCKQITLPTGETIHRHPDTVVVVTTNNEYAGCRDVNQSVISRMNLVFDLDEPSEKELADRVAAITGCEDTDSMKVMADAVKAIQERSRELSITDGSCGMRELIAWVQSFMITGNMNESAEYTILSSLSATPENREEIRETCVTPRVA